MPKSEYISASELALILGVHPETVRRWIRTSQGPPVKNLPGGAYRIRRKDADAWIKNLKGGNING